MTYSPEFKKTLARLYLDGRTLTSLRREYGVSESTIYDWSKKYREKCLEKTADEEGKSPEADKAEEIKWLRKRIVELEKENQFLKKRRLLRGKSIDVLDSSTKTNRSSGQDGCPTGSREPSEKFERAGALDEKFEAQSVLRHIR